MFGSNRRNVPQPVYVEWVTWTGNTTSAGWPGDLAFEDELRRIVREELADLVPVDVPDAPPKDL